jgi:membrane associated rhomboid family serine protease
VESLRSKIREAPVTVALAGVLVVVFGLEVFFQATQRPELLARFALSGEGLARGYWWTIVTHVFLHANLLHLFVNVLGLWFVGPAVEFMFGRVRYLVIFLVSGVCGGLLQTAFSIPSAELVGASGSVCGLLLAFTMAYPDLPLRALLFFVLPVNMKARTLGLGLMVFSLVCAALHIFPQIGHLAHLGGAIAGAFLSWLWIPSDRSRLAGAPPVSTDVLLERLAEEGIESLTREERKQLEDLADQPRRAR